MEVDQGLKKVCGIDLSKIGPAEQCKFLSDSIEPQHAQTERNRSDQSFEEGSSVQGLAADMKF